MNVGVKIKQLKSVCTCEGWEPILVKPGNQSNFFRIFTKTIPVESKKLIEEIASILKQNGVEKLILFGSYAWGNPTDESDIDLLAIKDIPVDKTRELRIQLKRVLWENLRSHHRSFDILVDSESRIKDRIRMGDHFYKDIYTRGKVIYA